MDMRAFIAQSAIRAVSVTVYYVNAKSNAASSAHVHTLTQCVIQGGGEGELASRVSHNFTAYYLTSHIVVDKF